MTARLTIIVFYGVIYASGMWAHAAESGGHSGHPVTPVGSASFVFPPKVAATLNSLKEISSRYSPRTKILIGDTAKKPLETVLGYVRQDGIDFVDFTNEGVDEHHGRHTVHRHITQQRLRQQIIDKKGDCLGWRSFCAPFVSGQSPRRQGPLLCKEQSGRLK